MTEFKLEKEGEDRLRVETPFPVGLIPWESFVLQTFPEFDIPGRDESCTRYLNRWPDKPVSEIAQGQVGKYYIHAYLPHCERIGKRLSTTGQVHVPAERIFYLSQITGDLLDNPNTRAALLERINTIYGNTLASVFDEFDRSIASFSGTSQELREVLRQYLSNKDILNGSLQTHERPYRDSFKIGELPCFMRSPTNFLTAQTALDFLRDLDDVLKTDRKLAPFEVVQVAARMHGLYDYMLPEDKRFKGI